MLAEQLEARVVMADYRLAPEHPFPAPTTTASPAYRGLLVDAGVDPARLVVSGRLVRRHARPRARCSRARDEGLALPAGFVSISGWFDLSVAAPGSGAAPAATPSSRPAGCAIAADDYARAGWPSTTRGSRPPTPT